MKNQIKTIVLLGALSALLVGVGRAFAPGLTYVFAAFVVLMNLGAYFFSDRLVLTLHRAREAAPGEAPELHTMVGELGERARISKPRVFVIAEHQPLLTPRELRAVLAHEIAHLKNRDILLSSTTHPRVEERVRRLEELARRGTPPNDARLSGLYA